MKFIRLVFLTLIYFILVELTTFLLKRKNEGFDFDQKKRSFLVICFALITNGLI
ncbi:hypothetical protein [uncultured Anaerococcus sp.]|uniref:hypothetical protein n=1 Tax=uncultured Anaerococcus sp. TaxID=293428 RepID=UPI0028040C1C|nr:hypothetical protein [uncultured Anaerococcus sp.]